MVRNRIRSLIALIPLCLILSNCGFHLRGMVDMPRWLNHIAVIIEQAQRDLGPSLVESLQSYNLTIDSSPASAQYWLIVQHDNLQKNIASISSSTTPRQYELIYTVQFKLMQAKGRDIIPPSTITITRQATVNSDRILGSNQEEALLIHEMMREAATQIINRISKAPHMDMVPPAPILQG